MSTIVITAGEFAALEGVDYQTAAGTLRYLRDKGLIKEGKTRPVAKTKTNPSGRGKPSQEYLMPAAITLTFGFPKEKVTPEPAEPAVEPVTAEPAPIQGEDLAETGEIGHDPREESFLSGLPENLAA
jgi:hypothetical protein